MTHLNCQCIDLIFGCLPISINTTINILDLLVLHTNPRDNLFKLPGFLLQHHQLISYLLDLVLLEFFLVLQILDQPLHFLLFFPVHL